MKRIYDQKRTVAAKGSLRPGGIRKISISFDDDMFDRISADAARRGISFNAACRDVIRAGISANKNPGQ